MICPRPAGIIKPGSALLGITVSTAAEMLHRRLARKNGNVVGVKPVLKDLRVPRKKGEHVPF